MRTSSKFRAWVVLGLLALGFLAGSPAWAQTTLSTPPCGSRAASLLSAVNQQQSDAVNSMSPFFGQLQNNSNQSSLASALSACVGAQWPNTVTKLPTMEEIIKGVAAAAVAKACGEARSALQQSTSVFNQSYYLNTGIPGMPTIGGGTSSGGGGSILPSSTTPSNWGTINNLFGGGGTPTPGG